MTDYYLCDRRTKKMFGLGQFASYVANIVVTAPLMPDAALEEHIFKWWYVPEPEDTAAAAQFKNDDARAYARRLTEQLREFLGDAGPGDTFFLCGADAYSQALNAGYVVTATRYEPNEEPNGEE